MDHWSHLVTHHFNGLKEDLFKEIEGKIKVYLDMNFFIDFICVDEKMDVRPHISELYSILEESVNKGKVAILISDAHIRESLKKKTDSNFKALISKMSSLSNGYCIVDTETSTTNEILFCLRTAIGIADADKLHLKQSYTRPAFIMFEKIPSVVHLLKASNCTIDELQISLIDSAWQKSLSDIISKMSKDQRDLYGIEETESKIINYLVDFKPKHENMFSGFYDLFKQELYGSFDLFRDIVEKLLNEFFETYEVGFSKIADMIFNFPREERAVKTMYLIVESILNSKQYNLLPFLTIGSGLHSLKRFDTCFKYRKGDHFDFMHSRRALPYADLFFIDRTMCNMIRDKRLKLDKTFKCDVFHSPEEGIKKLNELF